MDRQGARSCLCVAPVMGLASVRAFSSQGEKLTAFALPSMAVGWFLGEAPCQNLTPLSHPPPHGFLSCLRCLCACQLLRLTVRLACLSASDSEETVIKGQHHPAKGIKH